MKVALISVGILVFLSIIVWIVLKINERSRDNKPNKRVETPSFGEVDDLSDFPIINKLPNNEISVDIVQNADTANPIITNVGIIAPGSTTFIKNSYKNLIVQGNMLYIFIKINGIKTLYSRYVIDKPIDKLFVGMMSPRYIGKTFDLLNYENTASNAVRGIVFVRIHNMTEIPLLINKFIVPPHSSYRYAGYMNNGVPIGTIFKNGNGLYKDFQMLRPYSDLYYGQVSNLDQPLEGCFQYEYDDYCDPGQTLWPFSDGIY